MRYDPKLRRFATLTILAAGLLLGGCTGFNMAASARNPRPATTKRFITSLLHFKVGAKYSMEVTSLVRKRHTGIVNKI